MFRNQYIVVSRESESKITEMDSTDFDALYIWAHSNLNVSVAKRSAKQLAIIGFVIDPIKPNETNDSIAEQLVDACTIVEDLFINIQSLTGRFVLLFKTDKSFVVAGDACHLRQIYFAFTKKGIVITSSLKLFLNLFNYKVEINPKKKSS